MAETLKTIAIVDSKKIRFKIQAWLESAKIHP